METVFVALRAVTVMSAFVLLWGWVAWSLRPLDARLGLSLPEWAPVPGLALIVLGAALALTCAALFVVKGRGTPAPFDAPRRFVAAGPYRHVRNPMYLGAFLVLAGAALSVRSPSILMFSAVWLLPAHLFVILYEEPTLRRKFGASYDEYCRAVPRWVPRGR
jgi:protein-S-isoprenylcysteine O-methyltransferase Ste14